MSIDKARANSLIGKHVYVLTRKGQVLEGTLDKIKNDKIYLRSNQTKEKAKITAFFPGFFNPVTPLVLFDLLAIEEFSFFRRPFFGGPFFW